MKLLAIRLSWPKAPAKPLVMRRNDGAFLSLSACLLLMLAHGVELDFRPAYHRLTQLLQQQHAGRERNDEQPYFGCDWCGTKQRVPPRGVVDQQQQQQPEPVPISSTLSPALTLIRSVISATMKGREIVCP